MNDFHTPDYKRDTAAGVKAWAGATPVLGGIGRPGNLLRVFAATGVAPAHASQEVPGNFSGYRRQP